MAFLQRCNGLRLKRSIVPGSTRALWPRPCISSPSSGGGHRRPRTIDQHHMIRAIIFDFDGLILDTELPEFQSWQEIYEAHGSTLSFTAWATCIGTVGAFDPYAYLEE